MLRAVTARSPGVRTLSLLLTQLGGSNTVSSVVKESNDWDTLKHAHNWFKHYYGTESSSRKEVSGNSWVDTELNKFEEYVKERRVMSLAAVMKNEMLQEELEDDQKHVPVRAGGFEYYIECPGQFPLIYRALSSGIEGQELVLDTTELAELVNETHLEMHAMKISRQGDTLLLLAQAGDSSVVFVRDMASMVTVVQDHILDAMNVEYDANDNIYFTCADELGRPSKVYSVAPIAKGSLDRPEPRLEFEDHDRRYFVGIQRTKDWGYMCINSVSKTSSEVRIVDPNSKQMVVVRQREQHCEYVVEHAHGHLVILSNHEDTLQNQLYFAKISPREDGLQIGTWKPAPYRARKEECFLADVTVHQRACTLLERATNGLPRLRVLPFEHYSNINSIVFGNQYDIPVPEWALDVQFGSNEEFMSDRVEFELQSPILPPVHLEWDLKTKEIYSKGLMDHVTPKLEQYNCIRVPLKSSQGIHIPLTLAYRNDAKNPSKCLFIAYGAYGENLDMSYQSYFFPLLNRDWKIVFVHVRGGGEKGRAWYHAGRTPHKLNSESDLYECIKTLTEKGIVLADKAAIMTFSAGAIPVCGVLNMYPNIGINAVIMDSPFVDVLESMKDVEHPLTLHEHDEFGALVDGRATVEVARICPTASMRDHDYPSMLVTTGKSDMHVNVHGIQKYMASLRKRNTRSDSSILMWPDAFQNHLPAEGDEILDTRALQFAFLESEMNR